MVRHNIKVIFTGISFSFFLSVIIELSTLQESVIRAWSGGFHLIPNRRKRPYLSMRSFVDCIVHFMQFGIKSRGTIIWSISDVSFDLNLFSSGETGAICIDIWSQREKQASLRLFSLESMLSRLLKSLTLLPKSSKSPMCQFTPQQNYQSTIHNRNIIGFI